MKLNIFSIVQIPALRCWAFLGDWLHRNIYFGRHLSRVPNGSVVIFPIDANRLSCGLTGIVSLKTEQSVEAMLDPSALKDKFQVLNQFTIAKCTPGEFCTNGNYLGGQNHLTTLYQDVQHFKRIQAFHHVFTNRDVLDELLALAALAGDIIDAEAQMLSQQIGRLSPSEVETITELLDILKDIHWSLKAELAANIYKVEDLISGPEVKTSPSAIKALPM